MKLDEEVLMDFFREYISVSVSSTALRMEIWTINLPTSIPLSPVKDEMSKINTYMWPLKFLFSITDKTYQVPLALRIKCHWHVY